jgi:hypothetical protein
MNSEEMAYIAGILDGEGSICMTRVGRETRFSNPYWRIVVSVTMCDADLIDWLQETTGVGSILTVHKDGNRRTQYRWSVATRQARDLLAELRPWLRVKAYRADLVAELSELMALPKGPGGKYADSVRDQINAIRIAFDNDQALSVSARGRREEWK